MTTDLTIRLARPDDRPAMERICAPIWEGQDYLPHVWNDWLTDGQGPLLAGEVDGQVVALSKISFYTPGEAWLQGMRVDADYRRQGIAARFLEYSLDYARDHGAHAARLSTGDYNTPVHTVAARAGMERIGIYAFWLAEPLPDGPQLATLSPGDRGRAEAFLQAGTVLDFCRGVYERDWAWRELFPHEMAALLREGRVVALEGPDGSLRALAVTTYDADDQALGVGLAEGSPSAVAELASAVRVRAGHLGAKNARAWLPELPWLRDAFASAGYAFGEWRAEMWLLERRFPSAQGDAHAP